MIVYDFARYVSAMNVSKGKRTEDMVWPDIEITATFSFFNY